MACAAHQPAAGNAEFAGECREGGNAPQSRAAVLIALETIAPGDDRGCRLVVPPRQRSDVLRRDPANLGGARRRIDARGFHVGIESQYVLADERAIEASDPL